KSILYSVFLSILAKDLAFRSTGADSNLITIPNPDSSRVLSERLVGDCEVIYCIHSHQNLPEHTCEGS
ncbi:MAG: hypothetical protein WD016_12840, partial [Balneolaceae bacterium]